MDVKKQINKEALITIILYLVYFLWWYFWGYIDEGKDPSEYVYILGLPRWFFFSCVVGLIFINILVWIAIKFFFKEIDLDEKEKEKC